MTARSITLAVALLTAVPAGAYQLDHPDKLAPETLVVRNATVWTQGPDGILERTDLLIRDGKIRKIGKNLPAPKDAVIIDATGKHVTPGLIDCHSHSAISGGVNEGSNNITAEVRIADVIRPDDIGLYRELAGGLTTAHLLHGSANSIGGQDAVIKLKWHSTPDEMLIPEAFPGIKFALGENPKRSNFRAPGVPPRYPNTRMGVNQSIRERFLAAQDYMREWQHYDSLSASKRERTEPPRRDLQLEAIAEILRGERVIHSHSYRQDEILALLRLAEDFDITIATFQHVLEGYKVADELAAHGAGASTFSDWWGYKLEAYDAIPYNGALMHDRGVVVTFNSDSSELARRMNLEAAKAVKYGGVDPHEALGFVTLNAAVQLGIDDRVGSLEQGKDADFVIWSGDPLSVFSIAEQTWVDGVREFDRRTDLELRDAVARERARSIERIKTGDSKPDDDESEAGSGAAEDPDSDTEAPATGDARALFTVRAMSYSDPLAASAGAVSIVHATVHTLVGNAIEDGTVSIRGGKIVEVGRALPALAGAEVVDASGKHVYPGMIDASTSVGLIEIGSVAGSVDISESGSMNPQINTSIAVNPDSELIPVTRANGITHVLTVPGGGVISGTSALIRLDGWTWEDVTALSPAALHLRWPSFRIRTKSFFGPPPPSEEDQKKEREEQLRAIDEFFDDARAYAKAKAAEGDGSARIDVDPALEAMLAVLDGSVPVMVHAGGAQQIKSALEWFDDQDGLRMILVGSGDVWRVADMLADRNVPVILASVLRTPSREDEPYDTPYTIAAKLHAAGVKFAISTGGGSFGSSNTRNLPYHAAMAAAFGLPHDVALKSVMTYPAEILGVGDVLGTIEPGKSASLIITDGDPLEITTQVEGAFIDGRAVELERNRHFELFTKYSNRPRAE